MASSASIRALSRRSMASQRSPVAGEMSVLCALHTAATSKNRLRFFSEASSQAYTSRSSAPLVRRTRYLYSSPSMSVMVGVLYGVPICILLGCYLYYTAIGTKIPSLFSLFFSKKCIFSGIPGNTGRGRSCAGLKVIKISGLQSPDIIPAVSPAQVPGRIRNGSVSSICPAACGGSSCRWRRACPCRSGSNPCRHPGRHCIR